MEEFAPKARSKKAPTPYMPKYGYWIIGIFLMMILIAFTAMLRARNKPPLESPAQAAFDYPTKIRQAAHQIDENASKILESATESAKIKEMIFRARLESRSKARSVISNNETDGLIASAVGHAALANTFECNKLFEEIPPPPTKWAKAYNFLKSMNESLHEIQISCNSYQRIHRQRRFQGVENDPLLDDPKLFEADLDALEVRVSGIRIYRKIIDDMLPE